MSNSGLGMMRVRMRLGLGLGLGFGFGFGFDVESGFGLVRQIHRETKRQVSKAHFSCQIQKTTDTKNDSRHVT